MGPLCGLSSRISRRTFSLIIVLLAMAAAAIFLGYESRGQTLKGDEWDYAIRLSSQPLGHALFQPPPNKYLMVVPLLLYKFLFEAFGIGSYTPYRIVGIALVIVSAGLVFLILRKRVGDLLAVPPTVLLLFFGAASEVVVTSLRLPSQVAIAAGLGALLALERRTFFADLLGCALLLVAFLSHPESIAFVVAAAVLVVMRPSPERWVRCWVFLVPLVVYAILSSLEEHAGGNSPAFERLSHLPAFVAQSFVAVAAAVTGAFGVVEGPPFHTVLGWVVGAAVTALIALTIIRRANRVEPMFWALLAALATLLVTTALAPVSVGRTPGTPRYLYPEAILLLLLLGEAAKATRISRPVALAATAVLAAALVANVEQIRSSALELRASSELVKAELAAMDIAQRDVDPNFVVFTPQIQAAFGHAPVGPRTALGAGGVGSLIRAGEYFTIDHDFGSPAYSPAQLASLSAALPRQAADMDLVLGLGVRLRPAPSQPPADAGIPPTLRTIQSGKSSRSSCLELSPQDHLVRGTIAVPTSGLWIDDFGDSTEELSLSRFAPVPAWPLQPPTGSRASYLKIPRDKSRVPWTLWASSDTGLRICRLGSSPAAR